MLGFFGDEPKNETKELNGFVLFKHWDGNINEWTVDLFTPESYKAMMDNRKKPIQNTSLFNL